MPSKHPMRTLITLAEGRAVTDEATVDLGLSPSERVIWDEIQKSSLKKTHVGVHVGRGTKGGKIEGGARRLAAARRLEAKGLVTIEFLGIEKDTKRGSYHDMSSYMVVMAPQKRQGPPEPMWEARPRKAAAVKRLDPAELKSEFTATCRALHHSVSGIQWDQSWAKKLVELLAERRKSIADYAARYDEAPEPLDVVDVMFDDASRAMATAAFSQVRSEVEHAVSEYQTEKAGQMADEAGFESDSHYVEASDFLSGMQAQEQLAKALDGIGLDSDRDIQRMLKAVESFASEWDRVVPPGDGGWEASLVEPVYDGLRRLLPLLGTMINLLAKAQPAAI